MLPRTTPPTGSPVPKLNSSGSDLLQQMRAAIDEHWGAQAPPRPYDPLIEMAIYAASPSGLTAAQKFHANREIAQYIHSKKKSVEHTGNDNGVRVLLVEFTRDGKGVIIDGSSEVIENPSSAPPSLTEQTSDTVASLSSSEEQTSPPDPESNESPGSVDATAEKVSS